MHAGIPLPPADTTPLRADTSPPQPPTPPAQSMLGDTVNARAVRILLECNLVSYLSGHRKGVQSQLHYTSKLKYYLVVKDFPMWTTAG